jgi:hypothetical protein
MRIPGSGVEMRISTGAGVCNIAGRATEVAVRKISGVGETFGEAKPIAERLQASESPPRKDSIRRGLTMNLTIQALYPIDYSFGYTLNKRLYRNIRRGFFQYQDHPKDDFYHQAEDKNPPGCLSADSKLFSETG